MGAISPWHLAILAVVVIALFGAKRLPDTARGIGQSLKILKTELSGDDSAKTETAPTTQTAHTAQSSTSALPGHAGQATATQPAEHAKTTPSTPSTQS